jgi:hypothetical protein
MPGRPLDADAIARMRPWFPHLDLDRVRIVSTGPVCWIVRYLLRQGALALPPYIFYGRARPGGGDPRSWALLAHELVHCDQARRMGRVHFLVRYAADLARAGFRYSRRLPLEVEAYTFQDYVRATWTSA